MGNECKSTRAKSRIPLGVQVLACSIHLGSSQPAGSWDLKPALEDYFLGTAIRLRTEKAVQVRTCPSSGARRCVRGVPRTSISDRTVCGDPTFSFPSDSRTQFETELKEREKAEADAKENRKFRSFCHRRLSELTSSWYSFRWWKQRVDYEFVVIALLHLSLVIFLSSSNF